MYMENNAKSEVVQRYVDISSLLDISESELKSIIDTIDSK